MNLDFSYCKNNRFLYCRKCKRNLDNYSYKENDKLRIWLISPEIQNDTCYDFVKLKNDKKMD